MSFEKNTLDQDMESIREAEAISERLSQHMDDAEILTRRELILGIVEDNINENGTVSRYDIARINEVLPETDNLRQLGSDEQLAGALNAIGAGKAGLFRLIIGLLMGVAGIGMMVYGFIQSNKEHEATMKSIRDATDSIKDNAVKISVTTLNMNAKPIATEEVKEMYKKLRDMWFQMADDNSKELPTTSLDFIKNQVHPWELTSKGVLTITTSQLWRGNTGAIRELSRGMEILTRGLAKSTSKVEDYLDDFAKHLAKGEPLPKNYPDPEESMYIDNPWGQGRLLNDARESLLERAQVAWPMRFKDSELGEKGRAALAFTGEAAAANKSAYLISNRNIIDDACGYAMGIGDKCADNIKTIADLSTKMANRLKTLEGAAKNGLSNLEGQQRGEYNLILRKINIQINALNKLSEVISNTILNATTMGKRIEAFLKKAKAFSDLSSKMVLAAYQAGTDAEKKGAGNNAFGLAGLNDDGAAYSRETTRIYESTLSKEVPPSTSDDNDDMPTAVITIEDELGLEKYVRDIDFELESIDKLQTIAERINDNGMISRTDVDEIESAAPGLMALIPDQPNFTFRPSTIGLEPALNAMGSHISKKGGIIGAIIAAIAAVIGFILAKIFGGSKGTGKDTAGISQPSPETAAKLERAQSRADALVEERAAEHKAELERQRVEHERAAEEARAQLERAKAELAAKADAENKAKVESAEEKAKREEEVLERYRVEDALARIRKPEQIWKLMNDDKLLIFTTDKNDASLPSSVIVAYDRVLKVFKGGISEESLFNKSLSVKWLVKNQPSIFSSEDASGISRFYNTFIYAPDAVKRIEQVCKECIEVGERIRKMSDLASDAHDKASVFWLRHKPRNFRSMEEFNKAMDASGFGKALDVVKEHSQALIEDTKKLSEMRALMKFEHIDTSKEESIMKANPIPPQIDQINSVYAGKSIPSTFTPFRDRINEVNKLMDQDGRHQDYDGGIRGNGGFYLSNNVYGDAGMRGDGKGGKGVNLELRKELIAAGMSTEVFSAIARVEREHIEYINQSHRRIQGALNASAYILSDLSSAYSNAVKLGARNVTYAEKMAILIKELEGKG